MTTTCEKCGQTDLGQTGEYPCDECGLPKTHDLVTCPACECGTVVRLVRYQDGNSRVRTDCRFCEDTGQVSPERAASYRKGIELRELRSDAGIKMRAFAAKIGVTGAQLSDMENGAAAIHEVEQAIEKLREWSNEWDIP